MTLSRARIKKMEQRLRPPKVYLILSEWLGECYTHGGLLPGHELHPGAAAILQEILGPVYFRNALQVHQATPEDLAALGLEGRDESSLTVGEMCALLNRKLGRPLDAMFDGEELRIIGQERYLPAEPDTDGGEETPPDANRTYKPGFPRSIFRQDCTATN